MKGGSNRKPDAVKKMQGTYRADRATPGAPQVQPTGVPEPPKGLTPGERAAWLELRPQIDSLGVFSPSDLTALRLLCKLLAMLDSAGSDMPASAVARIAQIVSSGLQRFGLDPASRGRVPAALKGGPDEIAEFLSGRNRFLRVLK